MRVLHVNTSDISGGAARAAYRIHKGLQAIGVDSKMFVQSKVSDENSIYTYSSIRNKLKSKFNIKMEQMLKKNVRLNDLVPWSVGTSTFSTIESINDLHPDVVNLHWINNGFIGIKDIAKINAKIVWTLHDMWPFTGGCHYAADNCYKYCLECSDCALSDQKLLDIPKMTMNRKKKSFPKDITIVSPSNWLAEEARRSSVFSENDIHVIHNGIDTDLYYPKNKKMARELLGIPQDDKVILFGAMSATSDKRKGFHYLYDAIKIMYNSEDISEKNISIVVFGGHEPENKIDFGFRSKYVGMLNDDISLSVLYSAADVMIVPSHAENYPNTILEAMACGTPCVGFDIGGIPDFINHKVNGYLARHYDTADMAAGIQFVLDDAEMWKKMSLAASGMVKKHLTIKHIAAQYRNLYESLL